MGNNHICDVNPEEQVLPTELEMYASILESEAARARELAKELRQALKDMAIGDLEAVKGASGDEARREFQNMAQEWDVSNAASLARLIESRVAYATVLRFWNDPLGCPKQTRQRVLLGLRSVLATRTGKRWPSEIRAASSELRSLDSWVAKYFQTAQVALQTGDATVRIGNANDIPTFEEMQEAIRKRPYHGHRRDKALCTIAFNIQALRTDELSAIATLTDSITTSHERH